MALKRKIDKKAFDKLPAELQAEYVEKDGSYELDVEGDNAPDTGALRRAKDRAVQDRKDAEARAKEAEDKLAELDTNDAKKTGDIEKLEAKWKKDKEDAVKEVQDKLDKRDTFISTQLTDAQATAIATKLAKPGSANLLLPHIRQRLQADMDADEPTTQYMGADGKAVSLEAFEKSFLDNADFKDVVLATKASGGGAPGKNKGLFGGAAPTDQQPGDKTPATLASQSPKDLAAQMKAAKEANAEG